MSEELSTLNENITILSIFSSGVFYLSVYKKGESDPIRKGSWFVNQYRDLLKGLLEDYFDKRIPPQILGQTLSDNGLIEEIIHYIAPNSFNCPGGPSLDHSREEFIYWIKSKISNPKFSYFNDRLDYILKTHLERKQEGF
ncbi:MAG: hypothetical protein Q8N63_00020 [Nanoarchaeota archaeon]|nr:hypothetical protein [Nanoarchaeota archaeon]